MSKSSKKKLKWLIPIAVLSATCLSAGMLAGCRHDDDENNGHTHAYEWKYEGDEHWKECPADGAEEEGTRGPHDFVDGECECGATEAPKTYGKVTGKITLRKLGGTDTDFSGIDIDMGDEVEPVFDAEAGTFTVENVEVGKSYSLTVSKPGYLNYAVTVQVSEENEIVKIGGERGIVLEYEAFGYMMGWDTDLHDFSHVNDAEPYITFRPNEGGKSFNVITKDSYKNVAATVGINYNNSTHGQHSHGLAIKFEDGKHIILRFHYNNDSDCGIQFTKSLWGGMGVGSLEASDSLLDNGDFFNKYGEKWLHTFDADEVAEVKGEEKLPLTAVLKDGRLTVLYKGAYVYACDLPDGYGDKNAQIILWSWDGGSNAVFEYGITEQLPAMEAVLDLGITQPENAGCTVTATPAKEKYAFGEEIELAVTPASGYKLDALTVNGKDMYNSLQEGKLTVIADRATVEVKATFSEIVEAPLSLTVKGKKLGTTANLAKDTEVTLSGIATPFTVNADGKITADAITLGRYTVTVAGYLSQEINLTEELTEIVLEYDAFGIVLWDGAGHDLSHVNDDEPYIEFKGPGTSMNVISKEALSGDFSVSVVLKAGASADGDRQQGVILQFEDGKAAILNINVAGTPRLQFRPDLWKSDGGLGTAFTQEWVEFKNVTAEEVAKYNSEEGVELTVERRGASLYTYLDGVFHGKADLPEGYADDKAGFGFFAFGAVHGSKWYFEVSEALGNLAVTVTDGTEADANGSIEISPAEINMGDTVTITVTPDADYVLDTLTVSGGITVTKQENGTYTFVASLSEHTVTATFKSAIVTVTDATAEGAHGTVEYTTGKIVIGDTVTITVTPDEGYILGTITVVDGASKAVALTNTGDGTYTFVATDNKYTVTGTFVEKPANPAVAGISGVGIGNTPISLEGKQVTLKSESGTEVKLTVTEGKISQILAPGTYTLSLEGYFGVEVTVGADGAFEGLTEGSIVLKHDAFKVICYDKPDHDLTHVCDDEPYIGFNKVDDGTSMNVISKEALSGNFSVSVVLKSGTSTDGDRQQGIILRFEDGKAAILNINIAGTPRLQFRNELWKGDSGLVTAFTKEWVEFKNVTAEEVANYQSETGVKLTVERRGASLYTYLDGVFHGKADLPEGYADDKAEIGFFAMGAVDGSKWYFEVSRTLIDIGATVTDGTATGAHGSIEISPDEIKLGDTVTITVTPDADYVLDTLTVSGGITATKQENGTYTFVASLSEHTVTATFKSAIVTVTDATAEGAHGKVEFTAGKIVLGDTVTITVTPDEGYILGTLTVADGDSNPVALTNNGDGTYTFVATGNTYTVTGTFIVKPTNPAEANISGIGLGNTPIDFEGKKITLTPEGGTAVELTVTEGKISQILAPGNYTLSIDGYYSVEVTVGADGMFEGLTEGGIKFEKILFVFNAIGEPYGNLTDNGFKGNVADSTKAASEGVLSATAAGSIYEWSVDEYQDVAFTVTLKNGNGNQGILMNFGDRRVVRVRFESPEAQSPKAQWIGGDWWWGTWSISSKWDFGEGENYAKPMKQTLLDKYNGGGLKLTLLRKGGMVYALIDGEIYGVQALGDFGSNKLQVCYFAENATAGYEVPFTFDTNVDAILADKVGEHGEINAWGKWTVTDSTVAVTGDGYLQFANGEAQTKESLTIQLKSENSNAGKKAQGILYSFADGKWICVRIERDSSKNPVEAYFQYSGDPMIPNGGGSLKGDWSKPSGFDHNFTAEELAALDGTTGINLTICRNGRYIHVLVDGELVDTITLEEKYAAMEGMIGVSIENGAGKAFAYEHKVGDEAIPAGYYTASVSTTFPTEKPNNYDVSLDKQLVKSGESVTLTIKTNASWWNAWSYFPTSVKVNGEEKFVSSDMVSNGANRLTYTLTIENVTANTAIEVVIAKGTTIENGVVVTVKDDVGGTAVSDSGANGYYWNDGCDIYMTPAEGYEIESITVDGGTPVTSGWTFDSAKNHYVYSLPDPIHEPVTVVVAYKVAETDPEVTATVSQVTDPTTAIEFGADITEDDKTYEVLAYERYGRDSESAKATATVDADNLMDGTNLINACQNVSGSFGGHGYAVSANDSVAEGSCFYIHTGTVDLKITKNVSQIRIYVGAWSGQTGTFALKTKDGTTLATTDYANDGTENKNDVIIFAVDTTAFNDGDSVELVLDFVNTTTDGTLPCAGIQILGEKAVTTG